jgi:hypothetical protein
VRASIPHTAFIQTNIVLIQKRSKLLLDCHLAMVHFLVDDVINPRVLGIG